MSSRERAGLGASSTNKVSERGSCWGLKRIGLIKRVMIYGRRIICTNRVKEGTAGSSLTIWVSFGLIGVKLLLCKGGGEVECALYGSLFHFLLWVFESGRCWMSCRRAE